MVLKLIDGTEIIDFVTIVIVGDVTSNGSPDTADISRLVAFVFNEVNLVREQLMAAHIQNFSLTPDTADISRLVAHVFNEIDIFSGNRLQEVA